MNLDYYPENASFKVQLYLTMICAYPENLQ